jgi:hydrogenase maturation protease
MSTRKISINVPALARVEGEGALEVDINEGAIERLQLRIYEPPRYFEKFLEGRDYREVPDIVARICGICPVAYQMSAVQAIESIFRLAVPAHIHQMRRAMYCGEWLQSHSLHIHLLAAPDFLGFDNVTELAAEYPDIVQRGLHLQALGNQLIELFGARSVHPVGVCVGGFHHLPDAKRIHALVPQLETALDDADALIQWTASLALPDEQQAFTSVALRHAHDYPMNHGRLVSSQGLDIDISEFENHFAEQHIPHSTALHCLLDNKPYLVGPLARLNLNLDRLSPRVTKAVADTGIEFPSQNMFHSIVARAVEIMIALQEAVRLLKDMQEGVPPKQDLTIQPGTGFGCSEAPRGILWHRYEVDNTGLIKMARIVPPTSQNQARIEQDLQTSLSNFGLDQDEAALRLQGEKVIRNYDPCISCATHFLKLDLRRDGISQTGNRIKADTGAICIIGIGSPTGADSLGWQVIDYLQSRTDDDKAIQLIKLDRPGTHLLEYMKSYSHVVLVDAIESTSAHAGPLHLSSEEISRLSRPLSSHALGLAETLALANTLSGMQARTELFGLAIQNGQTEWEHTDVATLAMAILQHIDSGCGKKP